MNAVLQVQPTAKIRLAIVLGIQIPKDVRPTGALIKHPIVMIRTAIVVIIQNPTCVVHQVSGVTVTVSRIHHVVKRTSRHVCTIVGDRTLHLLKVVPLMFVIQKGNGK